MKWTDDEMLFLLKLAELGRPARWMASVMEEEFGRPFSRNACIGQLSRLRKAELA